MRKLLSVLMLSLTVVMAAQVEAKSFSSSRSFSSFSSGSSFSSSRSFSSPSRPSYSAPSRIGGSSSIGMKRPEVTRNALPSPSYRAPAPSGTIAPGLASSRPSTSSYSSSSSSYRPSSSSSSFSSGPSAGSSFMAGLGGGLVGGLFGSMLGNALTTPNYGVPAMAAAPGLTNSVAQGYPPSYLNNPVASAVAPTPSMFSGFMGFLGWLANFLLLVGMVVLGVMLAYWLARKVVQWWSNRKLKKQPQSVFGRDHAPMFGPKPNLIPITPSTAASAPTNMDNYDLPFSPLDRFFAIQQAFAQGDDRSLRAWISPDLQEVLSDLPKLDHGAKHTLIDASYHVLDRQPGILSIQYQATDTDLNDGGEVNEVWHFVRRNHMWFLNGIEQVA